MAGFDVFGKKWKGIWEQFAEESGGTFIDGKFWNKHRIEIPHEAWTMTLDTHTVSNGKSSVTYTRVYAPYQVNREFKFKIYKQHIFANIGKMFGMEDIEIGYPEFDDKFIIKGNNKQLLKQFFEPDDIRGILKIQPSMNFQIRDRYDDRMFKKEYPHRVQDICYRTTGIIKEPEWMHDLCTLVSLSLDRLVEIGCATEMEPKRPKYQTNGFR